MLDAIKSFDYVGEFQLRIENILAFTAADIEAIIIIGTIITFMIIVYNYMVNKAISGKL